MIGWWLNRRHNISEITIQFDGCMFTIYNRQLVPSDAPGKNKHIVFCQHDRTKMVWVFILDLSSYIAP